MTIHDILYQYWGYNDFRPTQQDIIESILQGNDTLALLPTGGGKSICYQVPALAMDGLCLVISPLIALMKDQVETLRAKDIPALMVNSTMNYKQVRNVLELSISGKYKFLYLSPERLETSLFLEYLPAMDIILIAVDEAHCISQWGYDFRPTYLRIANLRTAIPNVPILAVTASATPKVQVDIQEKLLFAKHNIFQKSFERPNISYSVLQVDNKIEKTIQILKKVPGSAIIYCKSRKRTKEVSTLLQLQHIPADYYHAGLTNEEREAKQQAWITDNKGIIVCTNAFGMGIDKPNVRVVIHYDCPDSIENYYQEAGRAGRDELKAYAVLLYQNGDVKQLTHNIDVKYPAIELIKLTYYNIANYLQVAAGSSQGTYYDFDLNDYCKTFDTPALVVANILQLLEQEELLSYTDAVLLPSTVQFTATRDQLNDFEKNNLYYDALVKCLLRNYAGIYDYPTYIHEKNIAYLLRTTVDEVMHDLAYIQQHGILLYNPIKSTPQLYYITSRASQGQLHINEAHYLARKKNYTEKVELMISYIQLQSSCRSNYISYYFGVPASTPCKACDNCITIHNKQLLNAALLLLNNKIILYLTSHTTCTWSTLVTALKPANEQAIKQSVQYLLAENVIVYKQELFALTSKR